MPSEKTKRKDARKRFHLFSIHELPLLIENGLSPN